MLKMDSSAVRGFHCYGMKFVSLQRGTIARVFDFNPYKTRKILSTFSYRFPWLAMPEETKFRRRHSPFDTAVVTSLKGCEIPILLIPDKDDWESTMITEDHVVMVQVGKFRIAPFPH